MEGLAERLKAALCGAGIMPGTRTPASPVSTSVPVPSYTLAASSTPGA
jgi:hypothetical protein